MLTLFHYCSPAGKAEWVEVFHQGEEEPECEETNLIIKEAKNI